MNFTEEDGIITAQDARARSSNGVEDSIVREALREVMAEIRKMSYYGYLEATTNIRLKTQDEFDKIKEETEKLGFKVTLTETSAARSLGLGAPTQYDFWIDIEWSCKG